MAATAKAAGPGTAPSSTARILGPKPLSRLPLPAPAESWGKNGVAGTQASSLIWDAILQACRNVDKVCVVV